MHTEPIQRGAERPQGRPRHALPSALVRMVAIAGLVFAGWLTLSALTHSAFAAERAAHPAAGPDAAQDDHGLIGQAPRVANLDAAAALDHLTADHTRRSQPDGQIRHDGQARHDGRVRHEGLVRHDGRIRHDGRVRHHGHVRRDGQGRRFESPVGVSGALPDAVPGSVPSAVPGSVPDVASGGVGEIGDHPVRYLRARQQDVLDGKDRAVRQVRAVADEAGVPYVGVPDLLQGRPVIGGLVHRVTDQQPLLPEGAMPDARQGPKARRGVDQVPAEAAPVAKAHTRSADVPLTVAAGGPAHESAEPCTGCRGDHRTPSPGPALPSGQDGPRGGGSGGGHPFAPIADLLNRPYAAAPSAADPGTFRRTALRDVAAPGGPSVVPD
ncbi:hypothetical protein ACLQ2P_09820 [Actinomadura citrea]|uniref:hypothetical protein n=1 Tax=Actinomadura citrea TaxID=46158 RepID=UPI003CE553AF